MIKLLLRVEHWKKNLKQKVLAYHHAVTNQLPECSDVA